MSGHEVGLDEGERATFRPSGPLRGSLIPPADKSISHRAAIIGAIADGPTRVINYLDSDDTRSTLSAVAGLGAMVNPEPLNAMPEEFTIEGVGPTGPRSLGRIDVGNAGTLMRLLPGWLAGCDGGLWRMNGDASIRKRPVDRIADPLRLMGAEIEVTGDRFPPIRIDGHRLSGIEYELPVASAQVKSCILLAGLQADGPTTVIEPVATRDHTEVMLAAAGADITREPGRVTIRPGASLELDEVEVPADISSAAFFLAAASIVPGSEVVIDRCGVNPTRTGMIDILERMGAEIEIEPQEGAEGEPIARITVRSAPLTGTRVEGAEIPLAIDELPLVALAACFAEGETIIADAEELKAKESDRIAVVVGALAGFGANIEAREDGMRIIGTGGLRGGKVDSHGDHRIAMLGAIAGIASTEGVTVENMDAAAVSYPTFQQDLARLLD
ncbi:MAG: 3-phosphoshikimate 1-carboxyvinyltransferase [Solirubrobacterales bacterium]|nr:3-phosphoshikimate 1-carboxyvinyltransferase [Solirubrobacterales bacterium]OJU95231.1 MAG: 3-phosphoshikimate 1-carboxyvinyltransferase [Solirubrobacterales bacterium 67-14]